VDDDDDEEDELEEEEEDDDDTGPTGGTSFTSLRLSDVLNSTLVRTPSKCE
jgi:hypothetical protein